MCKPVVRIDRYRTAQIDIGVVKLPMVIAIDHTLYQISRTIVAVERYSLVQHRLGDRKELVRLAAAVMGELAVGLSPQSPSLCVVRIDQHCLPQQVCCPCRVVFRALVEQIERFVIQADSFIVSRPAIGCKACGRLSESGKDGVAYVIGHRILHRKKVIGGGLRFKGLLSRAGADVDQLRGDTDLAVGRLVVGREDVIYTELAAAIGRIGIDVGEIADRA